MATTRERQWRNRARYVLDRSAYDEIDMVEIGEIDIYIYISSSLKVNDLILILLTWKKS
jgi:hypothetical protein